MGGGGELTGVGYNVAICFHPDNHTVYKQLTLRLSQRIWTPGKFAPRQICLLPPQIFPPADLPPPVRFPPPTGRFVSPEDLDPHVLCSEYFLISVGQIYGGSNFICLIKICGKGRRKSAKRTHISRLPLCILAQKKIKNPSKILTHTLRFLPSYMLI